MTGDHVGGARGADTWRPGAALLLVGLAAAAIRVVYTLALGQHVELGVSDASFYSAAANHLAAGDGYIDIWRSIVEAELMRTAHHPPGWPALLSVASLLGIESQLGHRLVGALLGGVVVVVVGLLGRRLVGRPVGLVAAVLAALHPTLVAADGSLMAETLAGLLLLVVLLVARETALRPAAGRALLLGVAIGLAALVRGEALLHLGLVVLPVAAMAARRGGAGQARTFVRVSALALVGTIAVVAPWTVRNTLLFDRVVLLSINDSTVLAGANCDPAYEGPGIGTWHVSCVAVPAGEGGTEAEEAAIWRERGLDHIRQHRDRLPAVVTARVLRTWGLWDVFPPPPEGRHAGTQHAGNVFWLALLVPGGIAGGVVLARRRRHLELWLLLSPVVAATVVSVVGFGMIRFRHPMELSAVVLTAVAVVALRGQFARTRDD